MVSRPEVLIESNALLGEGPRWDAEQRRLLWVDIERGEVHAWDGIDHVVEVGARVGAVAPAENGELLVALADRLAFIGEDGIRTAIAFPHAAELRANDGICDSRGRFWIGTMRLDEAPGHAALYRYDGVSLEPMVDGIGLSNGIAWSPDETLMYYVDTLTSRVDVFDYDGDVANRRTFVEIDEADGLPDGLAVDDEGGVWVALWAGRAVRRYAPDGTLDEIVSVPADNVTACCFGGDDGRTLFITTAKPDGRVFYANAGVSGPAAQPFRNTAPSDAEPTSAR
ncbi:MAG TPA: SMP-30/gluconolactonase/LRE family protein [Gaiellaceae bacterium]|jgi:sugar lactone lactonase YvrE|nr:SMP-30/gluconolactonase/LRE family protein [Gaiellaceae bacterium]